MKTYRPNINFQVCYIGDVPVEATYHGSTVLHRLFDSNQTRCEIIELSSQSNVESRLPAANYHHLRYVAQSFRQTRLRSLSRWLDLAFLDHTARRAIKHCQNADLIVTVAHGLGWLVANSVAKTLGVPLHLIVHDFPSEKFPTTKATKTKIESEFKRVYLNAASRLCVSPYMEDYYRKSFGIAGEVLLPGRSKEVSQHPYKPPRERSKRPFTIGFFGTLYSRSALDTINLLTTALRGAFGDNFKICIYGTPIEKHLRENLLESQLIDFRGYIPSVKLVEVVGKELDALFLPISFDERKLNMSLHFPSKLTDYTATGLPILVHGPPDSSAVKWTSQFPDAFIVSQSPQALPEAVGKLKDIKACTKLGSNSYRVGNQHFDFQKTSEQFWGVIERSVVKQNAKH